MCFLSQVTAGVPLPKEYTEEVHIIIITLIIIIIIKYLYFTWSYSFKLRLKYDIITSKGPVCLMYYIIKHS